MGKKMKNVIKYLFVVGMLLTTASESLRQYENIVGGGEGDKDKDKSSDSK